MGGTLAPFPSARWVWDCSNPKTLICCWLREICRGRSTSQSCCHCEMLRSFVRLMEVTMKYREIKSVLKCCYSARNFVTKAER